MKNFKKYLSLILCMAMVMNFTLPNFATDAGHVESSGSDYTTTSVFDEKEDDGIVEEEQTEAEEDATENKDGENNDAGNSLNENSNTNENNDNNASENESNNIETTNDSSNSNNENQNNDESSATDNKNIESETSTEGKEIVETTTIVDDENVATDSDATPETTEKDDYAKLSTIDQFNYLVEDSAKLVDGTVTLLKDITLYDAVRFNDDLTLDLNGFTITGPDNNYALYVENNFTIIDSTVPQNNNSTNNANTNQNNNEEDNLDNNIEIKSFIKSANYNYPAIYAKKATLNLGKTQILAADGTHGGDAIHLYESDIIVDGAIIKGGNGIDVHDDKGGDGGNAIVVYKATKQNIIKVNNGSVSGGNGGKGLGDETPDAGAAISYNGIYQGGVKTGKGRKGNKGGGNGGMAINILTKDFAWENVTFETMTLFAGSAGGSIIKIENNKGKSDSALFGTVDEDVAKHYYSLYDLNGKNYLTSKKDQDDFGLCAVYAMCAQIETYIMMEFPEFVKDVCHKVADTVARTFPSRDQEINLSEVYFGMAQNKTPTDAFGNAGSSDAGNTDGWTWGTSTQTQVTLASTWRGLVFEDDTISDIVSNSYPYRPASVRNLANNPVSQSFVDSYANKTAIHAKNMRIHESLDYVDDDNNFDQTSFIRDLKTAIVKNHGVYFGLFLGGTRGYNYTSSTGVNYGNVTMFYSYSAMSGNSGHGMYIIGWDDDYEYTADGTTYRGVFILKNSWNAFALVPQNGIMNWVSRRTYSDHYDPTPALGVDFMTGEYMPAFTKYENNYFYDAGVSGVSMNSKVSLTDKVLDANTKANVDVKYKKVLNVFKIRNDKEKALAASFYANLNDRQYEVALYKVRSDTNEAQIYADINDESRKLVSKTFTTFHGVNVIDFDTPVDLLKGQYIAVVITADEDNMGRIWIDGEGMEEVDISCTFHHTTTFKNKSFLASPTVDFKNIYVNDAPVTGDEFNTIKNNYSNDLINEMNCRKVTNANFRIKLWTNNYVTINTGDDGNIGGSDRVLYYPTLKASMSDLPTPTVTNVDKKFVGYNTKADGSGKSYDNNSVYSLDIADYLTLYAQYENKVQPTSETPTSETPTSETPTSETPTSETPTQPSIAPTEPTPTQPPTQAPVQETTQKNSGGGYNGGGGGGGGGGGRGGGGGAKANIAPPEVGAAGGGGPVSKVESKSNDISINSINASTVTWETDTTTNKWRLNVGAAGGGGGNAKATTGFYVISKNTNAGTTVVDTYYIDNSGTMLTGWLNTSDGKWYFFDTAKDGNEGKMSIGWKKILNDWYYFQNNGTMMVNGLTPDGYKVGADGKYLP